MKTVIVYYSLENSTHKAACLIAEALGADLCRLLPVKDVSKEGSLKFLSGGAMATFGKSTPIQEIDMDFSAYDRIILGTPIWAGKATPAINAFLKLYPNQLGKITALFTLSGGGDDSKCVKQLKAKLNNLSCFATLYNMNNDNHAKENEERIKAFIAALS